MTEIGGTHPPDVDAAIRRRIIERAKAINSKILTQFALATDDLEADQHRAALGALDGLEDRIQTMRSLLRLIES